MLWCTLVVVEPTSFSLVVWKGGLSVPWPAVGTAEAPNVDPAPEVRQRCRPRANASPDPNRPPAAGAPNPPPPKVLPAGFAPNSPPLAGAAEVVGAPKPVLAVPARVSRLLAMLHSPPNENPVEAGAAPPNSPPPPPKLGVVGGAAPNAVLPAGAPNPPGGSQRQSARRGDGYAPNPLA